jgi:Protein of unknown function (DUF3313)
MSGEQPPPIQTSGFLGDYSQLKPGNEGQSALVYINPNAQWSKYTKVILDPVQFLGQHRYYGFQGRSAGAL